LRFDVERQTLALLDHPNVARILDAGVTAAGRPYVVVEHVPGQPITRYADQRHLTVAQRLDLFLDVCAGVQHAHQRGIIHRDLKPSNVLVAEVDRHATPKIIDFDIAKALSPLPTGRTDADGILQWHATRLLSGESVRINMYYDTWRVFGTPRGHTNPD
jgi:non-specific serine/threonine protein kinase/serine/threonine-protein kinase